MTTHLGYIIPDLTDFRETYEDVHKVRLSGIRSTYAISAIYDDRGGVLVYNNGLPNMGVHSGELLTSSLDDETFWKTDPYKQDAAGNPVSKMGKSGVKTSDDDTIIGDKDIRYLQSTLQKTLNIIGSDSIPLLS